MSKEYEIVEYNQVLAGTDKQYSGSKEIKSVYYQLDSVKDRIKGKLEWLAKQDMETITEEMQDESLYSLEYYRQQLKQLESMKKTSKATHIYIYVVFDCVPAHTDFEGLIPIDKNFGTEVKRLCSEARTNHGLHYTEPCMIIEVYDVVEE